MQPFICMYYNTICMYFEYKIIFMQAIVMQFDYYFHVYIEQFRCMMIQFLELDGSALASGINGTTLALVDAGIKLKG